MRRRSLLAKITEAARCGVHLIQLREKDLAGRELEALALESLRIIRANAPGRRTRLLINSRTDVALAVEADGVHLRSDDVPIETVRDIWGRSNPSGSAVISVSCHSPSEVADAAARGADFAVFAPVFEKPGISLNLAGLEALRVACHHRIAVLALGGVTVENAHLGVEAGAAGIAGVRLFQQNAIADVVRKLR